jgi:sterol desaturase/sphingolipid hydroxylase (fatty acid hydroxylase superfamily)
MIVIGGKYMTVNQALSYTVYPLIIATLFYFQPHFTVSSILLFVIGLLFWNMFEYIFHRFAFHNTKLPRKLKRTLGNGHRFHHRYPNNKQDLQLPILLTLPFSLLSLVLIYLLFGSVNLGWYYLGLIAGLFNYELMHYAAHHLKINLRYFKWMKRYHLYHHHKEPNSKFMVSNPVYDYIFRTHR